MRGQANEMCLVFLIEGVIFQSCIYASLAFISVIYAEGIARWSEGYDMQKRYGAKWEDYQKAVPRWRCRLTPRFRDFHTPASLYYADNCSVCNDIGRWFTKQRPVGLLLKPASEYTGGRIQRITYVSANGEERAGVAAISAGLQHIHIGWAMLAWLMQLPVIRQSIQLAMDASGAAPTRA